MRQLYQNNEKLKETSICVIILNAILIFDDRQINTKMQ